MVHGISLDTFPDNKTGLELLQEELTQSNADLKLAATPRYLTRPESRVGKSASTIVLAFHTEAEAKAHCSRGIIIDGQKKKTDRFWQARATDQCTQCQGFGHHWKRCKSIPRCRICAENHTTDNHTCPLCPTTKGKECAHTARKCALCGEPHCANDPKCTARANLIAPVAVLPERTVFHTTDTTIMDTNV
jgi:hypothetical protein